jgi:two-component system chemotaxis response regulator CheB
MSLAQRKIRVLVVDDSVVIRRMIAEVIGGDPELEIAGHAANGQIALQLLEQVSPDVVTLDIEMPVLDGLATLKAMRAKRYNVPVIMFSTLTERGAEATIDSLSLGASDYVAKPSNVGSYAAAQERIREDLIPKIKALCRTLATAKAGAQSAPTPSLLRRSGIAQRVDVVAIGCSTGGPKALAELLPLLPRDLSVPVLIVQHMPPTFTRFLAQRLTGLCQLPVEEANEGAAVAAGKIRIAPGGFHMMVSCDGRSRKLAITQDPPENSCRPSVDVLFRSLVPAFGSHVLAVVLTGMGQDGLRGCERLVEAGAHILVQDEASSVVWGMPGFVAKAGLADDVLPIPEIAARIIERVTVLRPFAAIGSRPYISPLRVQP